MHAMPCHTLSRCAVLCSLLSWQHSFSSFRYGEKKSYLSVLGVFSLFSVPAPQIFTVESAVHSVETWLDKFVCLGSACADFAPPELVD